MKARFWLTCWFLIVISALSTISFCVFRVDPAFHYHKPDVDTYYYPFYSQRMQNNGIIKHFDYDAIITGTSMIENFKTTEADELFGCHSVKLPFSGASYNEINDTVAAALKTNAHLKMVIRCLDMNKFFDSYDLMRHDLGTFPTYLYDNNPFNDVEYLLNRETVFERVYPMIMERKKEGFKPGIPSFDDYSRWQADYIFGVNSVIQDDIEMIETEQSHLSDEEKKAIQQNIECNVTDIADKYPNVEFYYYYSPYSVIRWKRWKAEGRLIKQLEAEAFITELIVPHENIHLFSFNNRTDITSDLNNYKDEDHYAAWINSLVLKWMHDSKYQITEDNYQEYLRQEYDYYTTFDYESVNDQNDYENDYYAAALLNKDLTGANPIDILNDNINTELSHAQYVHNNDGNKAVNCFGALSDSIDEKNVAQYLYESEWVGVRFNVDLTEGYNYLCFNGQKINDGGHLSAYVYDQNGKVIKAVEPNASNEDNNSHQYLMDLSSLNGVVTIILNGGNADADVPCYQFSEVFMY